jgi:transcription elongation factor Elf1
VKIIYNRFNKRGYSSEDDVLKMVLLGFVLVGIVLLVCCGLISEANTWNDGYCPVCGHKYRYVQAVGHRYTTSYMYVCDYCNTHIEVDYEPNWNEVGTTTNTFEITEETESSIEETTETTFEEGEWVT